MSTKFFRATHKPTGVKSKFHDTDFPKALFQEIAQTADFDASEWQIDLLDYKGDLLQTNYPWQVEFVSISLGELVALISGRPVTGPDAYDSQGRLLSEGDRVRVEDGAHGGTLGDTAGLIAEMLAEHSNLGKVVTTFDGFGNVEVLLDSDPLDPTIIDVEPHFLTLL